MGGRNDTDDAKDGTAPPVGAASETDPGPAAPEAAELEETGLEETGLGATDWRLVEALDERGDQLVVGPDVLVTARFADGRIAGSTGCNRYVGTCTLDGRSMRVTGIATTLRACPPPTSTVEAALLTGLERVAAWELGPDRLDLAAADGRVVLRFVPRTASPLVGTTWSAAAINNGRGAVTSLVEGSVVTATFEPDGFVSGTAGCNRFHGPFVLDPPSLAIGPLAATRMACPAPLMEQEAAFLAALARVATFAVDGDTLELRSDDGALQADFRAIGAG